MTPPVVYVPGWGSDGCVWDAVRARVPGEVVAWWDALDPAPNALDDALTGAGAPAVLVGWSLGGQLALASALRRPACVRALVLVGAPATFPADADTPGADPRALRRMRRKVAREPEAVLAAFWETAAWPAPPETAAAWRAAVTGGVPRDRLAAGLDHLATADLRDRLGGIAVSARVMHGTRDAVVPVAAGAHLAQELAHARMCRIDGGHALPLSHPGTVAAAVEEVVHDGHA